MPDRATGRPPRVSVVIPTHNRAEWLPRAVGSVLAQTWTDFELLIVDDHSTDETPAAIARFADARIRSFRHERNFGQSKALNTGIEHARGEYVAFLDDDDAWLPAKLAAQVALLDAAPPGVGLVYCWHDVLDEASRERIENHANDAARRHPGARAGAARTDIAVFVAGAWVDRPFGRGIR